MSWKGTVYRFASVEYSSKDDLITGMGAKTHAGRWNPKGSFPTVYTSLTPETALAESRAHFDYYQVDFADATPIVLTSIHVSLSCILDLTVGPIRTKLRVSLKRMRDENWRKLNQRGKTSLTQTLGQSLHGTGFEAILVPSFAMPGFRNLVIFPENLRKDSVLTITNESKLPLNREGTQ
ncbi:MAG: RES family NAD+ phosphorylase [Gemmataceae bacterium]